MASTTDTLIGSSVRRYREANGWSLADLAQRTGLSTAHLSRIESGMRSPSIAALTTIAKALDVSLGALVPSPNDDVDVQRHDSTPVLSAELSVRSLSAREHAVIHPLRARVPQGREWGPAASHEGEEWIFVIGGALLVHQGSSTYQLGAGDSLHFDALEPHRLEAIAEADVIIVTTHHTAERPTS